MLHSPGIVVLRIKEAETRYLACGERERDGLCRGVRPGLFENGAHDLAFLLGLGNDEDDLFFLGNGDVVELWVGLGAGALAVEHRAAAGARGGTVLHGKGTGAKADPKFHNISIAEEKEVILIVSKTEEKSEIMRSILKKAGPDTPAKAIAFSLPTSEVAGFGFFDS